MPRFMTRREREVTDFEEIIKILDCCKIVHVGLSDDGLPYVVPMNYGYEVADGKIVIYLHGALKGYKLDVLRKNPRCCLETECDVIPFEGSRACSYGNGYSSFMGWGTAEILEDSEAKQRGLSILMKTQTGKDFSFGAGEASMVSVIRIPLEEYTAKRRPLPERA